ncbi:MAG: hypothetical protein KAI47_02205, partial [Deltaproteobacteria bacterium]|nr:hypothetical protein [Deltaproteobacteria bacterium]
RSRGAGPSDRANGAEGSYSGIVARGPFHDVAGGRVDARLRGFACGWRGAPLDGTVPALANARRRDLGASARSGDITDDETDLRAGDTRDYRGYAHYRGYAQGLLEGSRRSSGAFW